MGMNCKKRKKTRLGRNSGHYDEKFRNAAVEHGARLGGCCAQAHEDKVPSGSI